MPEGLTTTDRRGILMTTDAVGGVWRYTLDLARGAIGRGVPVTLAVLGPAPDANQRAQARGLNIVSTGLALDWTAESRVTLAASTEALRALAARIGAASIHLHAPALAGVAAWGLPVVAVAHSCVATWWQAVRGGDLPDDFRWRSNATQAGLAIADAVIAPTKAHAEATRAVYGPLDIDIVRNGAAPPPAVPGIAREPAILTAGRLWDEAKNAAALDRIAPELEVPVRAAGPVAGPNGVAIDLPNLDLLGQLDPAGMARAYAGASVYASLGRYEPFGLSVLEAALAGLALVLSDIPSFRELWEGAAIFVPPDDTPLPALRKALAQAPGSAQARARRYTLAAMVDGTLAVHRRVGALV